MFSWMLSKKYREAHPDCYLINVFHKKYSPIKATYFMETVNMLIFTLYCVIYYQGTSFSIAVLIESFIYIIFTGMAYWGLYTRNYDLLVPKIIITFFASVVFMSVVLLFAIGMLFLPPQDVDEFELFHVPWIIHLVEHSVDFATDLASLIFLVKSYYFFKEYLTGYQYNVQFNNAADGENEGVRMEDV